jgi:lysophospholipase L1-like esterase
VLSLLLIPTIIIAFLPSFFHLSNTAGDTLVADSAVYCIGDSLTAAGYYETELTALLGSQFTVVNKGISGNTTSGMLNRFTTDVLNHDPDFSVIWGGVNDIRLGIPLATTESNLQSMYTQAHDAGIKVIAISMSPWKATSGWTVGQQVSTDSLHDWIMNTASNIDYRIEVYSLLENPGNPDAFLPAYDSGDHLHFNNAAGVVIGQAIYDAVSAMIAQPRNLAPAHGAISVSRAPTMQSTGFSASDAGSTHAASQWQITKLAGDYSNPVFDSGTDTSHLTSIVAPLPRDSTYYWHVRYQGSDGTWSRWSSETSFVISSPPSQPTGVSPSGSAGRVTLTPTLVASAFSDLGEGDSHAASQWQLRRTSGSYSSPIYGSSTDTTNLTAKTIQSGVLSHSTAYYWHVRYQDSTGVWSDWSAETFFDTSAKGRLLLWIWIIGGAVAAILVVSAVAYLLSRKRPPKRLQRRRTRSLKYLEDWDD